MPPLISESVTNSLSTSVNNSKFIFLFRHACHANPGADKKYEGSSPYISNHLSLNFSKTSASNNVSV